MSQGNKQIRSKSKPKSLKSTKSDISYDSLNSDDSIE